MKGVRERKKDKVRRAKKRLWKERNEGWEEQRKAKIARKQMRGMYEEGAEN
ncbi:hypothetical protein Tco_0537839, partial [Tanacetum coccineum]